MTDLPCRLRLRRRPDGHGDRALPPLICGRPYTQEYGVTVTCVTVTDARSSVGAFDAGWDSRRRDAARGSGRSRLSAADIALRDGRVADEAEDGGEVVGG
jgi:hypothetical protein